jgi:hypothetical protein
VRFAPQNPDIDLSPEDGLRIVTRRHDPVMEAERKRERWLRKHVPGYDERRGKHRVRQESNRPPRSGGR